MTLSRSSVSANGTECEIAASTDFIEPLMRVSGKGLINDE